MDVDPARWLGHAPLAAALERSGECEQAVVHLQRARRSKDRPSGAPAHRLEQRTRLERGDAPDAAEALTHGLVIAATHATPTLDLTEARICVGDSEGAQALLGKLAAEKTDQEVLTRLAKRSRVGAGG